MDTIQKTERFVPMEQIMPLIREQLSAGTTVWFSPRGVSMLPLLRQGIDAVELAPLPMQLRKYDIPLYQYPNGRYILHRIVGINEEYCICLGDNTYIHEYVRMDQMIAVVRAIRRGKRVIRMDAPVYRFYCWVWVGLYPLRKFARRAVGWLRRLLK